MRARRYPTHLHPHPHPRVSGCSGDPMTSDLQQVVKFCQRGQDRVSPVSDVDVGIYQLQRSEKLLGERVEKLDVEAQR